MEPDARDRLLAVIADISPRVIACSGGIDSMLLATLASRQNAAATTVAHAISPAVPGDATLRLRDWAAREGWRLEIVVSGEFDSEDYLSNPVNRCYYCKSKLYDSLSRIGNTVGEGATVMSGANTDDLGEYRPGLHAAKEFSVRHPYIEAGVDKSTIRKIARGLSLPFAEIPASPCLASRLYTGTRVTVQRLRAVEESEEMIRRLAGIEVVRCRIREDAMFIEVSAADRFRITQSLLHKVERAATRDGLSLRAVHLDAQPYRPGRAFVGAP